MSMFNGTPASSAGSGTSSASTASNSDHASASASTSIEGESAPEPDIPRLRVISHDNACIGELNNDYQRDDEDEPIPRFSSHGRNPSTATLTALTRLPLDDESLRIPREPAYGDDNADGDDDGNEEDIEDGDEYDEDDDAYDQLFDLQDPTSRRAALATASALFAQQTRRSSRSSASDEHDMDEVERSFLRCTKPICSKKQLISCLSSRSTSPGPISPLLSDEDFPSLCSSSTAPSSRRSSDGSHTPRVRFKKGCVITAVNLTWAPTTYDRAPIDVAESLDMHRCKNVEDAEGYAQDDEPLTSESAQEFSEESRGQWQAFAPGIYNADDLPADLVSRAPPSPSAPMYASSFSRATSSPEESPSSSDCQSGFSFTRSMVGYPLTSSRRQSFEKTFTSSSDSSEAEEDEEDSEHDDVIERCRGIQDIHQQLQHQSKQQQQIQVSMNTVYRPTARSHVVRHSIVSSMATVETSLGVAARELSDSLDESSRSSSPSLSRCPSDEDCLSSTPKAFSGASFMTSASRGRDAFVSSTSTYTTTSPSSSPPSIVIPSCVTARQANFDANGTHDTSPPPPEEQPARKVQRRLERRTSSSCSVSRFSSCSSSDIWESCEALGGF